MEHHQLLILSSLINTIPFSTFQYDNTNSMRSYLVSINPIHFCKLNAIIIICLWTHKCIPNSFNYNACFNLMLSFIYHAVLDMRLSDIIWICPLTFVNLFLSLWLPSYSVIPIPSLSFIFTKFQHFNLLCRSPLRHFRLIFMILLFRSPLRHFRFDYFFQ